MPAAAERSVAWRIGSKPAFRAVITGSSTDNVRLVADSAEAQSLLDKVHWTARSDCPTHTRLPVEVHTAARPVIGGRSANVTMPGAAATTAGTALVTGIAV